MTFPEELSNSVDLINSGRSAVIQGVNFSPGRASRARKNNTEMLQILDILGPVFGVLREAPFLTKH